MQAIKRGIKMNQKFQQAQNYSKQLEGIARITNWHESKMKNEKAKDIYNHKQQMDSFLKTAGEQLKIKRRTRLQILYKEENQQYEKQLKELGYSIYKTKI